MNEKLAGKPAYIRSHMSGVWRGTITDHAADYSWVQLADAEHLYRWQTNKGVTVSALAAEGINRSRSTIDPIVAIAIIRDVVEILPEN